MTTATRELSYHVRDDRPGYWRFVRGASWFVLGVFVLNIVMLGWVGPSITTIMNVVSTCCTSIALLLLSLQQVDANASGIHRPFKRDISWSDVVSVQSPGRFDSQTFLTLQNGRTKGTGLPIRYAAQLADLGGKPLVDQSATLGQK